LVNCLRVDWIDCLYVCRVCFDCASHQRCTVGIYSASAASGWPCFQRKRESVTECFFLCFREKNIRWLIQTVFKFGDWFKLKPSDWHCGSPWPDSGLHPSPSIPSYSPPSFSCYFSGLGEVNCYNNKKGRKRKGKEGKREGRFRNQDYV
jgi:hypothetical protein